ncbi:MAG: ABC transporter permease [Phycisphaerales bacterium]|nr:ABC transporter permease [Phycisphaerales bacterium]
MSVAPQSVRIIEGDSPFAHLQRLLGRRDTVRYLVTSQLKAGQRDKVLGHLWNLLDPLLYMLVYFFVFGVLFGQGRGRSVDFMLYIISGVLTWRFFDASINQCVMCVRSNRGLIQEINFPKSVFPVAVCLARLYDFCWGLVVLLLVLLVTGHFPGINVLWLPFLVAILVAFAMGLGFLAAYVGAFFADTQNVMTVALRLWFYTSPIFYHVSGPNALEPLTKHPNIKAIYMSNPMACIMEGVRDVTLNSRPPDLEYTVYAASVALATLIVGFCVFTRGEGKFAKYV